RRNVYRGDVRPRNRHSGTAQLAWKPQPAGSEGPYIVLHVQCKLLDPDRPACGNGSLLKVCSLHGPIMGHAYLGELLNTAGFQLPVSVDKDNDVRRASPSKKSDSIIQSVAFSDPLLVAAFDDLRAFSACYTCSIVGAVVCNDDETVPVAQLRFDSTDRCRYRNILVVRRDYHGHPGATTPCSMRLTNGWQRGQNLKQ